MVFGAIAAEIILHERNRCFVALGRYLNILRRPVTLGVAIIPRGVCHLDNLLRFCRQPHQRDKPMARRAGLWTGQRAGHWTGWRINYRSDHNSTNPERRNSTIAASCTDQPASRWTGVCFSLWSVFYAGGR